MIKKTNEIVVKPNDKIMVKKMVKDKKFDYVWNGPFTVLEVFSKYVIYLDGKRKRKIGMDYIKLSKSVSSVKFPLARKISDCQPCFEPFVFGSLAVCIYGDKSLCVLSQMFLTHRTKLGISNLTAT